MSEHQTMEVYRKGGRIVEILLDGEQVEIGDDVSIEGSADLHDGQRVTLTFHRVFTVCDVRLVDEPL